MFYWTVSISTLYFVHKKSQKSAVIRLLELFCFFALILRFSLRAEVSTEDPHPSTRSVPNIQSVLSKQKAKSFASLTVK